MAGRASIVGAAVTDVGKVRTHNEDSHYFDAELGVFVVCDGMGGHAAGEVASALAVQVIREHWTGNEVLDAASRWLMKGTPETRKALLDAIRLGVVAAHDAIVEEARRDESKAGMGTTLVAAMVVGGDCVFAHAGDSRAYLIRDGIAMQLTEDHTLMARLMAAGVEVDTTGEGSRFKSMLTNALGIGAECKVSTFVVPLADGDRFVLCTDGVSEYIQEAEFGEVATKQPSPARAAQRLVDLSLDRGGADNATALVVRVLEAGDQPQSAVQRKRDDEAIGACVLFTRLSPQQRLRALRIGLARDHADGERIPAQTLGDRVAWIVVDGGVEQDGEPLGGGTLLYPEALAGDRPLPDRDGLAVARGEVRAIALRSDDFRELCEDDEELGEVLLDGLAAALQARMRRSPSRSVVVVQADADPRSSTDPNIRIRLPSDRSAMEADVPVVLTDKPMVDQPVRTTQPLPNLKRLGKLVTPQGFTAVTPPPEPVIAPQHAPAPAPVAVAAVAPVVVAPAPRAPTPVPRLPTPTPVAATPAVAGPAMRPTPAPHRPVMPPVGAATSPVGAVTSSVGPVTPPPVPKLPKLPSLRTTPRAASEPSIIVSPEAFEPVAERVVDPRSESVEIDVVGDAGADDDADGPGGPTHVGPPPVPDDVPSDVPAEPDTQIRPPVPEAAPAGATPAMTLDLEPETHIDINPEDVAAIEKQKRRKRLTDGWED